MNAEAEASKSWFLHWTLLFNLYYLQLLRQCQRRVSTFYILFFGMSNDNNFHVENWLQVSHLGSNILCNLQCNISAVFPERRRLWRYLNFYSNNLAASLGCRVNTKHGGNCVSSCKGLPLRVLRKIICNYNWYYFVLEAITFLEKRNAEIERSSGTTTPWVRWGNSESCQKRIDLCVSFLWCFFFQNFYNFPFYSSSGAKSSVPVACFLPGAFTEASRSLSCPESWLVELSQ